MKFIKRLFCKHHYYLQGRIDPKIGDIELWQKSVWVSICSKCGKVRVLFNEQDITKYIVDKNKRYNPTIIPVKRDTTIVE